MQLEAFVFGDATPDNDFTKALEDNLDKFFIHLRQILNAGLIFSDNFNCKITTITTDATPGNNTAITHGLGRIPTGAIVAEKNKAGHIYLGSNGKSTTVYNVASDVASVTTTLIIF